MLHAFAAHLLANFVEESDANFALVGHHAHFDQRMRRQCEVNLVQDGRRQPMLTDHHHRIEMVRSSAQGAAGTGGKGGGGGSHLGISFFSGNIPSIISRCGPLRRELMA